MNSLASGDTFLCMKRHGRLVLSSVAFLLFLTEVRFYIRLNIKITHMLAKFLRMWYNNK